ncbi:MAG: glucosaminidase domain-containing protein [Evtepia sp.]
MQNKRNFFMICAVLVFSVLLCPTKAVNPDYFVESSQATIWKSQITDAKKQMDHAHKMAESARALGLSEDSEVVTLARAYYEDASATITTAHVALEMETSNFAILSHDVFKKSNLTAKAFNMLLYGSALAGNGTAFYELEQRYNINGVFAMAVAKTESGLGTSALAANKYNYFGMLGCRYASSYEGIMAFGSLMNQQLYRGKSIERIASTYCPPTAAQWAEQTKQFMAQFWQKIV